MLTSEATFLQGWLLLSEHQAKLPLQDWCHLCSDKGFTNCPGTQEGEELAHVWLANTGRCVMWWLLLFLNNVTFSPA